MTGDPADIGHAPVHVLGMDVLNVFRGSGDVSEIPAGTVLTALRLAGGAARIHQEQRVFGQHLYRIDPAVAEERQHLVHDEIAALDQRRLGRIAPRVPLPHQHLLERHAVLLRFVEGDVRFLLVIEELAATIIAVHRDQHAAFGIDDTVRRGFAAEAAEHLRVNDAEPRAREHGDRQLRHHRHVQRHAVALLETAEISQ